MLRSHAVERQERKDGAGAVVPIKITGTRDAPKMSVEMGRIFGKAP